MKIHRRPKGDLQQTGESSKTCHCYRPQLTHWLHQQKGQNG